jgi:hypothetical protein
MAYLVGCDPEKGPLFHRTNGDPLTQSFLVQQMRLALAAQGLDDSAFVGHSFRIRAATTALKVGISDAKLRCLAGGPVMPTRFPCRPPGTNSQLGVQVTNIPPLNPLTHLRGAPT